MGRVEKFGEIKQVNIIGAWDEVFQCIICSIFNPSSLLELTNGKRAPTPSEANSLLSTLETYRWASRIIHPIFRNLFATFQDIHGFVVSLLDMKINLFQTSTSGGYQPSRRDILLSASRKLRMETNLSFSPFQMHVLMRTIECCIDSPFGQINQVELGYGSECAAKCFLDAFKKANCDSGSEDLCGVVEWILKAWNEKVKKAFENNDPCIENELKVLQLTWEREREVLVHSNGRIFNMNDIEHSLCFYYVLHQHTLPSRNISTSVNLDGEKYHPIRFSSSEYKSAAVLPLMREFNSKQDGIRVAYLSLISSNTYENRYLCGDFKIDIDDDELEERDIIQIKTGCSGPDEA